MLLIQQSRSQLELYPGRDFLQMISPGWKWKQEKTFLCTAVHRVPFILEQSPDWLLVMRSPGCCDVWTWRVSEPARFRSRLGDQVHSRLEKWDKDKWGCDCESVRPWLSSYAEAKKKIRYCHTRSHLHISVDRRTLALYFAQLNSCIFISS